jgi:predicted NBD/HSP70 family sugar kinase
MRIDRGQTPSESMLSSGAGGILALVASRGALSRADIVEASGLARATVTQRLAALFAAGLIDEAPETLRSGGRPSRLIRLNKNFGVILVADIGESHVRLALTDLDPGIVFQSTGEFELRRGPAAGLEWIAGEFEQLLAKAGRSPRDILGIGLSMPAPVDFAAGRVAGPSIMVGWDDYDIRGWFHHRLGAPVYVENDVNLMTLAQVRTTWAGVDQMVLIKAGTGIGSGVIADGRLYRGANGAAGDIGHIQFSTIDPPLCRCGKLGCVEARAGGWAIARDLRAKGLEARNARDVMTLVNNNEPEAIQLVRSAGRVLGEVVADVVSVLNPSLIVIGGTLAEAGEHLLAGVRELVYQRSLPLATRELQIVAAHTQPQSGLLGAAHLVLDAQLGPTMIEQTIARHQRTSSQNEGARPASMLASPS